LQAASFFLPLLGSWVFGLVAVIGAACLSRGTAGICGAIAALLGALYLPISVELLPRYPLGFLAFASGPLVGGSMIMLAGWVIPKRRKVVAGFCPRCGYNLTGNVSGICPECGTPIARPAPKFPQQM
jgi:predicted RNA-binding Zn-ribbon protein involved in translation (DUF1610 family)